MIGEDDVRYVARLARRWRMLALVVRVWRRAGRVIVVTRWKGRDRTTKAPSGAYTSKRPPAPSRTYSRPSGPIPSPEGWAWTLSISPIEISRSGSPVRTRNRPGMSMSCTRPRRPVHPESSGSRLRIGR